MVIVPYTIQELDEINKTIYSATLKRLKIQDKKGWEDWMTLLRKDGGLGVINVRDLYEAQQLNGLTLTLNGPICPTKRALMRQLEDNMDEPRTVSPESPWFNVAEILKSREATMNGKITTGSPKGIVETLLKKNKTFEKWRKNLGRDIRNEEWENILFTRSPSIVARNAVEARTRLRSHDVSLDYQLSQDDYDDFEIALSTTLQSNPQLPDWNAIITKTAAKGVARKVLPQ